jgi:hypothetical protein
MDEITARSYELLAHLAEQDHQRELERLQRGPVDEVQAASEWIAHLKAMDPPKPEPKPEPQRQPQRMTMDADKRKQWDDWATAQIDRRFKNTYVRLIGSVIGEIERRIRADTQVKLDALRFDANFQIKALRQELDTLRNERGGEVVDLPAWRGQRDAA